MVALQELFDYGEYVLGRYPNVSFLHIVCFLELHINCGFFRTYLYKQKKCQLFYYCQNDI